MASKLIDTHPHIVSPDTGRYPVTPHGGTRSNWSGTRSVTFEQLEAAMDKAGVDKAAIVHSATTYGFNSAYVADVVAANRGRFTGVFSVDVTAANAPDKVRHWVGRGLSGIRIYTSKGEGALLADPRIIPAWEAADDLGITVCVLTHADAQPHLVSLAKRFPRTRIFIDHLLSPPIEEGPPYPGSQYVFDLARFDNIYLKLTTSRIHAARKGKASPETFFPRLVKEFGAHRIAWGSNYPASEGTLVQLVKDANKALSCLSPSDQDWIFARTAQVLYPALADSVAGDFRPAR